MNWVIPERPLLYVAGPINTSGNVAVNVRNGLFAAEEFWDLGWLPFVPHLSVFWNLVHPKDPGEHYTLPDGMPAFWIHYDLTMILHCAALYRLPGESVGADIEVAFAREHGIPVYTLETGLPPARGPEMNYSQHPT